ncbi:Type I secretion system permease/ATPase [Candidatus Hepatincolaceae symbiont of Richtersius coronifer]
MINIKKDKPITLNNADKINEEIINQIVEQSPQNDGVLESSQDLKLAFQQILRMFDKNVSPEVLYSNLATNGEDLNIKHLFELAKKVGLIAEMRRINILDINSGPGILLLSKNKFYVVLDKASGFNIHTQKEEEFKPHNLINDYTGYAIFFYEEDLSVSSFLKRTGFLFKSLGSFKHIFIEILVISFFINIFALISPFFTMNVYDRVIPNYAISTLFVLSFGMMLIYLFDLVFKVIKSYLSDYISLSIGNEVDQVLLSKILNAKAPGINMSNGAKNSLFRELSMVREFYFSRFIPTLIDVPFLILFFMVLLFISPWLMVVPLIASIIVFITNILLQVPLQNTHGTMILEEQQRNGLLVETIAGAESIKTFNAIGKVLYKWKRTLTKTYKTNFSYNLWVNIASNFSVFVMNIVGVLVIVVGVFEISSNAMTTGGLIAATTISARIMSTIISFSGMVVRYRSIQNTLRHLEKIVNSPMEDDTTSYGKKGPFKGNVKFKDVTFFYPTLKNPILNKCTFEIREKAKVAVIGKTGAGKSTITRLLLGLDFQNGGQVLVDNIDINNIHIHELRANIGFMPQKSYFFHGTVRDNILINNLNTPEEQYRKACDIAGVHLITALSSKGDDMIIEEQGKNLSGGQQQIIALARAILNDPPIIILDEPTNGMDSSLEATFMENIKEYVKEKTFILITHKPSQLNLVNRVILIDQATVIIDDTKEKVLEMLSQSKRAI